MCCAFYTSAKLNVAIDDAVLANLFDVSELYGNVQEKCKLEITQNVDNVNAPTP